MREIPASACLIVGVQASRQSAAAYHAIEETKSKRRGNLPRRLPADGGETALCRPSVAREEIAAPAAGRCINIICSGIMLSPRHILQLT